ncbi:MAG: Asp-tRNA(Asn)/Glu-tRNA(Gln) amidotransferase subunit GatC [Pseudomonadales bacterium]|jgi:aspartyl-tRNA(Asn)/glutamyl-tRNA(Gln) amidotransferase subunit C|nr:Asp-tRNA(Asn)/Glu-tRNA(Gln) amidotransferase subunit GatC [Pseudomonadales bacterium]
MSIAAKDIDIIAHLARLSLTDTERSDALGSIASILQLVNQMQAVDTSAVAPLAHPFEASQRLREDVVTESDQRETLLTLAPSAEQGLFLVPKVIE